MYLPAQEIFFEELFREDTAKQVYLPGQYFFQKPRRLHLGQIPDYAVVRGEMGGKLTRWKQKFIDAGEGEELDGSPGGFFGAGGLLVGPDFGHSGVVPDFTSWLFPQSYFIEVSW